MAGYGGGGYGGGGYGGGGYGGGGVGGGGYGGGGYGGGGAPSAAGVAPSPAATAQGTGSPAATPAQQITQLTSEIGRLQSQNPAPNSPTYSYLQGLQQQLADLTKAQQAPAANPSSGFARPGVQPPMQQDNNRSLQDLAMNGAGRPIGPMSGFGNAQRQATNVAAGRTPTGQSIQAPTIEGPSQKSLYSFVPSAQNGQNPTGLDSSYLSFLQQVFNQNRQNPLMMGAGGGTNANQTGASGVRV